MNNIEIKKINDFDWKCKHTWLRSAKNTLWCLLGCSVGDFGTILFFQLSTISIPDINIMILAIFNGLVSSILLEFLVLSNQMSFKKAFHTAIGMSFVSMLSMEIVMNMIDWILIGKAVLVWWIIPIMLIAGFITPWPYNYWRLKKYNIACH